jgi:hypothetical protein
MDDKIRLRIWRRYCDYDARTSFEAFRRVCLTVDHLIPTKHGGGSEDSNLVTYCRARNAATVWLGRGSVEEVKRFLRLYWAECSRPWFDTFVADENGPEDPKSCWDRIGRTRKTWKRFYDGDVEPEGADAAGEALDPTQLPLPDTSASTK